MLSLATLGALTLPLLADLAGFVSVRAEAGAGLLPDAPGAESEATVDGVLEPGVSLISRTKRSTLSLSLSPRFYQRAPNFSGVDRPLVLGRAGAVHDYRLTRRLAWRNGVSASYGEVDYHNLSLTFDAPDAGRAIEPVLTAFSASGETSVRWLASRRNELGMGASVSRYQPTGDVDTRTSPESTGATAQAGYTRHLDLRSALTVSAAYSKFWVDPGVDNSTVGTMLGYGREIDRLNQVTAGVGVGMELEGGEAEPYPRALFSFTHLLRQQRDVRISNRVSASWDARLDPTTGVVRRVLGVEAGLETSVASKWTLFLNIGAAFLTSKSEPDQTDDSDVLARAGATYRASRDVSLESGVDVGARLSSLAEPDVRATEKRARAFVAVVITRDLTPRARQQAGQ